MSDALSVLMRSARRRCALIAGIEAGARGLAAGAALLFAAALCHRFVAQLPAFVAAALLLLPIALALYASWRARPTSQQLARALDDHFAARSLIASAWATRAHAATPAAQLVLADARVRAAELCGRLAEAFPVALPRSATASLAAVLASAFLLVQPGVPAGARSAPSRATSATAAATSAPVARASEAVAERDARAPSAADEDAASAAPSAPSDGSDAGARAQAPTAVLDAGDAPGRAAATAGAADTRSAARATRWIDRARLTDGSAGSNAPGTATAAGPADAAPAAASALAAAQAAQLPYEPALAPALAAYVSAVARAEQRR